MQGLNELQSYCLLKQFAKQAQLETAQLANISEDQLLEVIANRSVNQSDLGCELRFWSMYTRQEGADLTMTLHLAKHGDVCLISGVVEML